MVYWTYEQDLIILDESLTDKEKQKLLKGKELKKRKRYLQELKVTKDKLDKEKQQMIDIYPDYTMAQIQAHLHKPIHYVRTRIHDLKQLGLLREEPIMTKKQKDYIALYASKSKADDLAEDLNLPVNLVKMAVSEEYRKGKIKDKPKKHDSMPKKMRWCEKGRPPQALDKRSNTS